MPAAAQPNAPVTANDVLANLHAALRAQPGNVHILLNVTTCLSKVFPAREWETLLQPFVAIPQPPFHQLIMNNYRLISLWCGQQFAAWQTVQPQGSRLLAGLTKVEVAYNNLEERRNLEAAHKNIRGYQALFRGLAALPLPAADAALPALYLVGDSHAVTPSGQTVGLHGQNHRVESYLEMGLKLWHLSYNKAPDKRLYLQSLLHMLPANSPVLMSAGEIDTRNDEGIWALTRKTGISLENATCNTVHHGIAWAAANLPRHRYIWSGVPAPRRERFARLFASPAEHLAYARFVADFNRELKKAVLAQGWGFLDVHSLTEGPEGFATGAHHIDQTHLTPATLATALQNHLLTP